jgi:hypothetical protein
MKDNSSLTVSISKKEIKKAIANMELDKALGPDGPDSSNSAGKLLRTTSIE